MQIEADITRIENELLSIPDNEDLTIRTALYRNLIVLRLLLWIGSGDSVGPLLDHVVINLTGA
jgi:hypothetical protein